MLTYKLKFHLVIVCIGVLFPFSSQLIGQEKNELVLDLYEILKISEKESFESFKSKNLYEISLLEYRNFKVEGLPTLQLDFEPLTYNRSVIERYDAVINRDVFRSLETLNSYAGLTISQNIISTGGSVFLNSNVNRLQNLANNPNTAYNNNIVRIGFNQSLLPFNTLKWNRTIAPLRFQKAQMEFLESKESIHINAVNLFFTQLSAQANSDISKTNYQNAVKLFEIGKERFKIATINKEEVLNLELNVLNAEVALQKANEELIQAQFDLMNFLGIKGQKQVRLTIPHDVPDLNIEMDSALQMAVENNSEMLNIKLKELNALKELEKSKRESGFNPLFSGSIGLNKSADNYLDSFIDPLTQNRFSLKIQVPILDWGTMRRKVEIAEKNNEIQLLENEQSREVFMQKVRFQVLNFNLQNKLVQNALKAQKVALQSHALILERFKYGNIDIIKLNAAIQAKDRAINDYVDSLKAYWMNYYILQKMILVDLKTNKNLREALELRLKLE